MAKSVCCSAYDYQVCGYGKNTGKKYGSLICCHACELFDYCKDRCYNNPSFCGASFLGLIVNHPVIIARSADHSKSPYVFKGVKSAAEHFGVSSGWMRECIDRGLIIIKGKCYYINQINHKGGEL